MLFDDKAFRNAVDTLDVKYIDGQAYMNIHTVDIINEALLTVIDVAIEAGLKAEQGEGEELLSKDLVQGSMWVMMLYKQVHDELAVRAEAKSLPDTVPDDLDK